MFYNKSLGAVDGGAGVNFGGGNGVLSLNSLIMLGYISIGVFIDGGYYAKVNRALKKMENSIIRVRSLFDFIMERLAGQEHVNPQDCQITEAHYFRGRFRVKEAYDKHLLYRLREHPVPELGETF